MSQSLIVAKEAFMEQLESRYSVPRTPGVPLFDPTESPSVPPLDSRVFPHMDVNENLFRLFGIVRVSWQAQSFQPGRWRMGMLPFTGIRSDSACRNCGSWIVLLPILYSCFCYMPFLASNFGLVRASNFSSCLSWKGLCALLSTCR